MKRTTVKLPDELDARLRHEAERRGVTIADVTRQALEAYLMPPTRSKRKLGFVGIVEGGEPNVAERIEEILEREWGRGE